MPEQIGKGPRAADKGRERLRLLAGYACLLLIAAVWILLPPRMTKTYDLAGNGSMSFAEREAGDFGLVTEGPGMTLRAGRYRLRYAFATDAENTVRLLSDNGVSFAPSSFSVSPESPSGEVSFLLYNEADNFRIEAEYGAGTFFTCGALTLAGRGCTDRLFTVSFLLSAAAAWFFFGRRIGKACPPSMLVCVLFAALMASVPCLKQNLGLGDDMNFHLERLSNLIQGLLSGQFPVRLGTYMNQGYGSVVTAFYPCAFLYPAAGMILAGASIQYAVHALLIAVNLLSALGAYHLGRRLLRGNFAGAVCSVLYTLAIYRLTDVYTRSALGESLAMAFLPFFAAELYEALLGDRRRWPLLALAAAALLHAHLLTTALTAAFALLIALPMLPRLAREGRLSRLALAFLGAALLGLCLAAPMLTFLRQGVSGDGLVKSLSGNAMSPAQLLSQTGYDLGTKSLDRTLRGRGYEAGAPLLLSALLSLSLLLVRREAREEAEAGDRLAAFCLGTGAFCLLAASTVFPWGSLPGRIGEAASFLQFPWRLLMIVDLCFSLCGAWSLSRIGRRLSEGRGGAAETAERILLLSLTLAFCLSSVLPMLTRETRKDKYVQYNRVSQQGMNFFDYSLPGTDSRTMTGTPTAEGAEILSFERAGTCLTLRVSSETGGSVTLPVFAFDGWKAAEAEKALPLERTEYNYLRVSVPPGTGARTVSVWYAGEPSWRICDAVSLAALAALLFLALRLRRG